VDVRGVAELWGGGGHKNAAGCTLTGDFESLKLALVAALARAIGA
jgi:phosphoesterase RecJ-like protein